MKVLVTGRGVPTVNEPMLGIFEFDQARALVRQGIDVTYLGIDIRSFRHGFNVGITSGQEDGLIWHCMRIPLGPVPRMLRVMAGRGAFESLYSRFVPVNEEPDIIHAHFSGGGNVCAALAASRGIPLVITEHSSAMNRPVIDSDTLKWACSAYKAADKLLAVSQALSKNIYEHTGYESSVVPNVVGCEEFYSVEKRDHDGFQYVFVGNMIPRKNPLLLLKAFKKVSQEFPDSRLIFVGSGSQLKEVKTEVTKIGLSDCVELLGRLPRNAIARLYEDCDCFVLPSKRETFGVVYIEAMAAGLPVIGTKSGGPEEFIDSQNGVLVEPDSLNELTEAMLWMHEHANCYDRNKLRQYVIDNYSEGAVATLLTQHYDSVLSTMNLIKS